MFEAHEIAVEIVKLVKPVLDAVASHDPDLQKQLRRAAPSILFNISEGSRRTGKDRTFLFNVAAGSAAEVRDVITVAEAWGFVSPSSTLALRDRLERELKILWRLTHPRGQ